MLAFEIRSRWDPLWIEVPVAAGLVLSYLLKVKLQQSLSLSEARVNAAELLERVQSEEPKHEDATFKKAYEDAVTLLDNAIRALDVNKISQATKDLDEKWRAALQDLSRRRQTRQDELSKLQQVTEHFWSLPLSVQDTVFRARDASVAAVEAIECDNLENAHRILSQIVGELGAGVQKTAVEWQDMSKAVLNALTNSSHGLSALTKLSLAKPAQEAMAAVNRVSALDVLDTVEKIQDALVAVSAERSLMRQVLSNLSGVIDWELNAVNRYAYATSSPMGRVNLRTNHVGNHGIEKYSAEKRRFTQLWSSAAVACRIA